MQKALLVLLLAGQTIFAASGRTNIFVTAGFPIYPLPALFATPDLMWSNTPVGQEFVSAVPQVDFVDVHFGDGMPAHYQIVLHEQIITGAVVAASEVIFRDDPTTATTRFYFSPPATLTPGTTYVLEFLRQEPITGANDSPVFYRPGVDYPSGRRVWRGVSELRLDLYFRAGVLVPSLISTDFPTMIADGVPRSVDSTAAFSNPFITNFSGATLKWELESLEGDSISLASGGSAEIAVTPETGDIYYNGGGISFARVLTNDPSSNSITVEFNASADANAVGAMLRSLLFTAQPRAIYPGPPRTMIGALRITFVHPSGQITEADPFGIGRGNNPPPTHIFVIGGHSFLNGGPVFITRRLHPTVSVECNFGTLTDADGDRLFFTWWQRPDGNVISLLPRFTNDYAPGLHWVDATVSDGIESLGAEAAFEVIAPKEAIARLRAELAQTDSVEHKRRLEWPLRIAAYAIAHREWILASRQLEIFRHRLDRYAADREFYGRWYDAAGQIKYAVAPYRRTPIDPGPGPFPRPAIPVPQPR